MESKTSVDSRQGRASSLPHKTKDGSSQCDWANFRTAKTWGTWTWSPGSDLSLPTLPNAFPSSPRDVRNPKQNPFPIPSRKERWHSTCKPMQTDRSSKEKDVQHQTLPQTASSDQRPQTTEYRPKTTGQMKARARRQKPKTYHRLLPPAIGYSDRPADLANRSLRKMRSSSLPSLGSYDASSTAGELDSEDMEILKLRKTLNMPREAMSQARDLFIRHADQLHMGSGLLKGRCLTKAGFVKLWFEMTHQDEGSEDDVPPQIFLEAFRHASQGQKHVLDFSQFATWFSSRYFCEDVSLDRPRRKLRSIARKYSMHHDDVETYEQIFASFDKDGSGTIDPTEFEELLYQCTKVPRNIGLPPARMKNLWRGADQDGDQEINFEEFLSFHSKYLGSDSTGFEDFYRFASRPVAAA